MQIHIHTNTYHEFLYQNIQQRQTPPQFSKKKQVLGNHI